MTRDASANLGGEELERDPIGVTETQARSIGPVDDPAVLDAADELDRLEKGASPRSALMFTLLVVGPQCGFEK